VAACTEAGAAARAEVGGRWRTRRRRIGGVLEQIRESTGPWREAAQQRPSHGEREREARTEAGAAARAVAGGRRWRRWIGGVLEQIGLLGWDFISTHFSQ
jgi:hypothetical protein